MIYEIATLPVHAESHEAFRKAFASVLPLLQRAEGYRGHVLGQGIEAPDRFTLLVRWRRLADHSPGFEESCDHAAFMGTLDPYLAAEPTVSHIDLEDVVGGSL